MNGIIASFWGPFGGPAIYVCIYCQDTADMSLAKMGELDHRPLRPLR
jgi:hypothetical protein